MINNELTGLKSGLGADFDKKEDTPTISDVTDKAIDPSKDINNEVPNQKLSSHASDQEDALPQSAENANEEPKSNVEEEASNNQAHVSDSQSDSVVPGAKEGANEEEESSNEDGALLRNAENAKKEPMNHLSRETSDHISSRQTQSSSSSSEEDFSDSEEEEDYPSDSKDDWTVAVSRRADADVALAKELMQKIANTVIPFVGCMMKYCIIMPVVEITMGGIECCKIIVNTTQKVAEYIKNGTIKAFDATKSFVSNHQVAVLTSLCVIAITVPAVYLAVTRGYVASMGEYISSFGKYMRNLAA